jgi:hypothetical protein
MENSKYRGAVGDYYHNGGDIRRNDSMGMGQGAHSLMLWKMLCVALLTISAYLIADATVYDGKLILAQTIYPAGSCSTDSLDTLVTQVFRE